MKTIEIQPNEEIKIKCVLRAENPLYKICR